MLSRSLSLRSSHKIIRCRFTATIATTTLSNNNHNNNFINNNNNNSLTTFSFNTSPTLSPLFMNQHVVRSYASKNNNKKGGSKNSNNDDDDQDSGSTPIKFDRKDFETKMTKHVDMFKNELTTVRTGRANPQLLENIKVKLDDGSSPALRTLGAIVVKNARLLSINVFDQKNVMLIMKAVREEELGFNPQAKANVIDVPVPKMTMEIRENVVKMMKRNSEGAKEKIRSVRRDAMNAIKKMKNAPKDDVFKLEKEMQTVTDAFVKKIDDLVTAKEKEILQNSQ